MSYRPLVLVSGLTFGDYLLWHWSLTGNHDVIALVSGLSLPPLVVALVWLLVSTAMRHVMGRARPPARRKAPGASAPAMGDMHEDGRGPATAEPPARRIAA
ncbi:MAG TPA: hypothetical protein VHT27_09705 [Solirubrobacteraceae bacterium]|nr:hypothetical protein [Solirubrobacteraceae bacterium]